MINMNQHMVVMIIIREPFPYSGTITPPLSLLLKPFFMNIPITYKTFVGIITYYKRWGTINTHKKWNPETWKIYIANVGYL